MVWVGNKWVLWSLCGVLLGIGFVFPVLWILGLGGVVFFIHLLQKKRSLKEKMLGAWLAWSIKAGLVVSWLWTVYPIDWLPVALSKMQLVLVFVTWLLISISVAMGALLFVFFSEVLYRSTDLPQWSYLLLIYPLLWVVSESFGSLILSLVFYGPGGSINTSFSFGYMGYLLAEHERLLMLAQVAGVYGLTLVLVWFAGLLWLVHSRGQYWRWATVAFLLVLYVSSFIPAYQSLNVPSEGYTVAIIDTRFTASRQDPKIENWKETQVQLEESMVQALALNPDYIVLPENSHFFDPSAPVSTTRLQFVYRYNDPQVVVIDSGGATYGGETVVQAFVYNGPREQVERFHKSYLVPQGEFLSTLYIVVLKLLGYGEALQYYADDVSYRIGPLSDQSRAANNIPAILFCFESFAPKGVRALMQRRPDAPFVVHIASHIWFHEPHTLWSQMAAMLKVQAVWNQQYIASAGNMVSGHVYTPTGQVIDPPVVAEGEQWSIKLATIPQ